MNDQDWDDYCWQRQGTAYGDMARQDLQNTLGPARNNRNSSSSSRATASRRTPSPPLLGEILVRKICDGINARLDAWIKKVSWKIWLAIGLCCMLPATGYAIHNGLSVGGVVFAALANLAFPWLFAQAIRAITVMLAWCVGYLLVWTLYFVKIAAIVGAVVLVVVLCIKLFG